MRRLSRTALNVNDKGLITLVGNDIKAAFTLNGAHVIPVIKNIFGKQFYKGRGCFASKATIAKEVGVSERQVFNILSALREHNALAGSPFNILISRSLIEFLEIRKTMVYWMRVWSRHRTVILKVMWIRCGKSVDKMWKTIFNEEVDFIPYTKILHTNNRILSKESIINNNSLEESILRESSERTICGITIDTWNGLTLNERKEISIQKLKCTPTTCENIDCENVQL